MKTKLAFATLLIALVPAALSLAGTKSKLSIEQVKNTGPSEAEIWGYVDSSDECTPQRKVKVYGVHGQGGTYFVGATRSNKKGKWSEELAGSVEGEQLLEANFPEYIAKLKRSGDCSGDKASFTLKQAARRAKRVDSKTSLNLGPRPGEFTGAVRADHPGCVAGRRVVVKRVDGADYVTVTKDFSDINGLWGKVTGERSGTWFAKLKPERRGNLYCKGDKSPARSAG